MGGCGRARTRGATHVRDIEAEVRAPAGWLCERRLTRVSCPPASVYPSVMWRSSRGRSADPGPPTSANGPPDSRPHRSKRLPEPARGRNDCRMPVCSAITNRPGEQRPLRSPGPSSDTDPPAGQGVQRYHVRSTTMWSAGTALAPIISTPHPRAGRRRMRIRAARIACAAGSGPASGLSSPEKAHALSPDHINASKEER
jgi:hypothetical protein